MIKIYKVFSREEKFAAFCQLSAENFSFFLPDNFFEDKYFTVSVSDWQSIRSSFREKDKMLFDSFDEIINAGCHFLAMRDFHFDREKVEISTLAPGAFFPRIWRGFKDPGIGSYRVIDPRAVYGHKYVQFITAAASLFEYLIEIFKNLEPAIDNLKGYGHKIRECLILACTEIETSWRAILEENTNKENYKKKDTQQKIM